MATSFSDSLFVSVKYGLVSFLEWKKSRFVVEGKRLLMETDSQVSINEDGFSEREEICSVCVCSRRWLGYELPVMDCKCWRIKMNPWVCWLLLNELCRSSNFRINLISNILRSDSVPSSRLKLQCCHSGTAHFPIRIVVKATDSYNVIDKSWCIRLETLILERLELDETMACLSTLGGAFSSLGDEFSSHAETAGRISFRQMRIALKLGDPVLLSKCKLYLALSLMQRGKISLPKRIIQHQYYYAKSLPENSKDLRLENMCKGAWAKLQHTQKQKRTERNESKSL